MPGCGRKRRASEEGWPGAGGGVHIAEAAGGSTKIVVPGRAGDDPFGSSRRRAHFAAVVSCPDICRFSHGRDVQGP